MPRPKYKHMSPYEITLWDAFLDEHDLEYSLFDYDIHVGTGENRTALEDSPFAKASYLLTQKRIDAVGIRPDGIYIFEVKANAALSALGQLIGYHDLFIRDKGADNSPILNVVTDFISTDDKFLFNQHNIRMYTYPKVSEAWDATHPQEPK